VYTHNSVRTIVFNDSPPHGLYAAISPDFSYVATAEGDSLDIYDMSTGKHLVGVCDEYWGVPCPWFTRDGREVLRKNRWELIKDGKSDLIGLEPVEWDLDSPRGDHFESPLGHNICQDGWIFDSKNKRIVWLPHSWRVYEINQRWDGRFLGLMNSALPEPVILEFDE